MNPANNAASNVFTRRLAHVNALLVKMDEKADDLNHLRWEAARELTRLADDGMSIDDLAVQLNRKPADVRSFILTWRAYGHDAQLRAEQTYSGLQRLAKRYPDDPKARAAIIETARAQKISVATALDHLSYSRGGGIRGGTKGRNRGPQDSFIKQLLALGAPLNVQEAWYGMDAVLHHFRQLVESEAVLDPAVARMVTDRLNSIAATWQKVADTATLAAMARGEE